MELDATSAVHVALCVQVTEACHLYVYTCHDLTVYVLWSWAPAGFHTCMCVHVPIMWPLLPWGFKTSHPYLPPYLLAFLLKVPISSALTLENRTQLQGYTVLYYCVLSTLILCTLSSLRMSTLRFVHCVDVHVRTLCMYMYIFMYMNIP